MSETGAEIKNAAIRLLARREHSRQELCQKLARRGESAVIQPVLDQLEESGYLSDQRFTESFVRMRVAQGHGLVRISFDLKQKGIDRVLLEQALDSEPVDWFAHAVDVCARKFNRAVTVDYKTQAKQLRYMTQRGFSMDEARYAVQQLIGDSDD
ncbi:MAG: regulatory protein RecX [Amphritea sp.]